MLGLKKHTSNKIQFISTDSYYKGVLLSPEPSSKFIPDWWKNMDQYMKDPSYNVDGNKILVSGGFSNAMPKKCVPMFDAFNSGYIIPLWSDVQVISKDNPYITWRVARNVFESHGPEANKIGTPPGYNSQVFKYLSGWSIKTPPGYSCLITTPLGYRDLPFYAVPAVIDTDISTLSLDFPVWIKSDIDEIVEKGTPIVQVIPFKRSDWKLEVSSYSDGEYQAIKDKNFGSTLINHYMRKVRQHKSYK